MNITNKKMPPAQALSYVIENAKIALEWLEELEAEKQEKIETKSDASLTAMRERIIADAFTIYISSLVDKTNGTHSLIRSYMSHDFIKKFQTDSVVKACIQHRHNRAGHQSQQYGSVIQIETILSSNLNAWLDELYFAVNTKQFYPK